MNCKPGDLAVVIRSFAGNEGRIVRCIRVADADLLRRLNWVETAGPVWVIDRAVMTNCGDKYPLFVDADLRPIRDPGDDATDETLEWLPVPHKETA